MRNTIIPLLLSYLLSATGLFALEGWITDIEEAKKKANEEQKDIFLYFTGSTWCPPCISFNDNVLSDKEFGDYMSDTFVLMKVDVTRDPNADDQYQAKVALMEEYGITGFPTMLFVSADAKPYAKSSYQGKSPSTYKAAYEKISEEKKSLDAALSAAEKLEGIEKAKKISEALESIPSEFTNFYEDEVDELIANDPEDTLGFQNERKIEIALKKLQEECAALQDDPLAAADKMTAFVESMEDLPEELSLQIRLQALTIRARDKISKGKVDEGFAIVDKHLESRENIPPMEYQGALAIKIEELYKAEKFKEVISVSELAVAKGPETKYGRALSKLIEKVSADLEKQESQEKAEEKTAEEKAGEE